MALSIPRLRYHSSLKQAVFCETQTRDMALERDLNKVALYSCIHHSGLSLVSSGILETIWLSNRWLNST